MKISLLGGDLRQLSAAKRLSFYCDDIAVFGIEPTATFEFSGRFCEDIDEAIRGANAVILPLPASVDGKTLNCPRMPSGEAPTLKEILGKIPRETMIIGGRMPDSFKKVSEDTGHRLADYFESEKFQIRNAYITAEAALSIAMNTLDVNIRGSRICVTGFGRISKYLVNLLLSMGAYVTVAARKESDLAMAEGLGCDTLRIMEDRAWYSKLTAGYDVIYNTVPARLFDKEFLKAVDKRTFMADLASAPGGIDVVAARELRSNVTWAGSLPGKYAPASAGRIIAECVIEILEEVGL